jgi:hypothetical protein
VEHQKLMLLLRGALKARHMVALRECADDAATEKRPTAEGRRLVREIEKRTHRKLAYGGRWV